MFVKSDNQDTCVKAITYIGAYGHSTFCIGHAIRKGLYYGRDIISYNE